jgi:hypothetical protein
VVAAFLGHALRGIRSLKSPTQLVLIRRGQSSGKRSSYPRFNPREHAIQQRQQRERLPVSGEIAKHEEYYIQLMKQLKMYVED